MNYSPKREPYDLDAHLNTISGLNVSIKASQTYYVNCSGIDNFYKTKNCELWYVYYKVIVPYKHIKIFAYFLSKELVDSLLKELNFDQTKLLLFKNFFFH